MSSYSWSVSTDVAEIEAILKRNDSLRWRTVHPWLLDTCLAMSPLELPPYVLLWIVDWIPFFEHAVSHRKKIHLIESIRDSVWRIRDSRTTSTPPPPPPQADPSSDDDESANWDDDASEVEEAMKLNNDEDDDES